MKRGLLVHRTGLVGSRYKFPEMFSRVCELAHTHKLTNSNAGHCDFGIVYGDVKMEWRKFKWRGIPYVLIENDCATMRGNGDPDIERDMIESAACVLVNTEDFIPYLTERYDCPPIRNVHLKPLRADLDFEPLPKRPRTVAYAGGLQWEKRRESFLGYRVYHDIFATLVEAGWQVHVYPAWYRHPDREREYASCGCVMHDSIPEGVELHREMSQYTLSFQGYGTDGPQEYLNAARPNKTWLGLAAGIPTLGFNAGGAGRVYEGKWGLVAPSLSELPATAEKAALMQIPDSLRYANVIDDDIDTFRELVQIAAG